MTTVNLTKIYECPECGRRLTGYEMLKGDGHCPNPDCMRELEDFEEVEAR